MWARSLTLALLLMVCPSAAWSQSSAPLRFNADIRPIFSDACFRCHGPDSATREAGLRLDLESGLFEPRDGKLVVDRDRPAASELIARIQSNDPDVVMPPPNSGKQLTPAQRTMLVDWVRQGAPWEGHWAFQPLKPQRIPPSTTPGSRNPIDSFVRHKLAGRNMNSAPEAGPETLARRIYLDLTGLPPTPDELDRYLNDPSEDRYSRLVDQLLASPRYGEHMAVAWLDAARYADTSGYQTDGERSMWRWRDWLIAALNAGMPYDQLTIEMLAGDLLPQPTRDQLIATGFQRNHRGNSEGGSIPEEFLVEYVVDRVDTMGTVWLGLTVGCARCHDHKYDPISQRDYYSLFAYFHNVPESGRALKLGNSPPYIKAPTPEQERRLQEFDADLARLERRWMENISAINDAQTKWEAANPLDTDLQADWTVRRGLVAAYLLMGSLAPLDSMLPPPSPQGSVTFDEGDHSAARFDGQCFIDAGDVGSFGYTDSFTVAAWIRPDGNLTGGIVSRMLDDSDSPGWALHLEHGKLQANFVMRWLDDGLRMEAEKPIEPGRWHHVAMTYDGSRRAEGVQILVDGEPQELVVRLNMLAQNFVSKEPLRIGSTGAKQKFTGAIRDVRLFHRVLDADESRVIASADSIADILRTPPASRTRNQTAKLSEFFISQIADHPFRGVRDQVRIARYNRREYLESIPTTMVMSEMASPRPTRLLARGSYEHPTDPVGPGVPAALGGPPVIGVNRMALARWLVSSDNSLPARVAVNREWQRFFGVGLVKTTEDFGSQGEPPSHPELLDWLASEFIEGGWDIKALHRLIVTSATYRQSSSASKSAFAADPENRLLARGPRFRLTAEALRDQALAIGGLLCETVGGESVRPYQVDGLWTSIASDSKYIPSEGGDLFRRSLYSFCKRTVGNPAMTLFDATTREACQVRRGRTNTPLQALAVLNETTYVEAARGLAQQALHQSGTSNERLLWMFRRATCRRPTPQELELLSRALTSHLAHFEQSATDAASLVKVGTSPELPGVDQVQLAAWTAVASVVLNLDEVVNRE